MFCLEDVVSFINKLNQSVVSFIEKNKATIKKARSECELAKKQEQDFIEQINRQIARYKADNFGSVINSVQRLIEELSKEYKEEFKAAKNQGIVLSFDTVKEGVEVLKEQVSLFNSYSEKLNTEELDSKYPAKTIRVSGEEVIVDASGDQKRFGPDSEKAVLSYPCAYDSNLVFETMKAGLAIIAIVDRISALFEKELDVPTLIKKNRSLLENYISEINANCETFVSESFSKTIDSQSSRDSYIRFFESMDAIDVASLPNIDSGSDKFKEAIQLGRLELPVCDTSSQTGKDILEYLYKVDVLKERLAGNIIDFPLVADLRQRGNVLLHVNCDNDYSEIVKAFVNQLVISFALSFPCSRVHFKLVDIGNKMGFSSLIAFQKVSNGIFLDGIIRDERELDDAIKAVKSIKLAAEDKLNLDAMPNVFDYNKKMDAAPMDVYLFVLVDFPSRIVGSKAKDIQNIVCNGKDFGIFSIIINNYACGLEYNFEQADYKKILSEIAKTSYVFEESRGHINYIEAGTSATLHLLTEVGKPNLAHIIEVLSKNAHAETSKPIPLTKMFEYMDCHQVASIASEFEIPFGLAGADVQTLRLGKEPHSAVIGGTGSGKSIFFHTLILDACYRYSPEELNFYLLDFKGGMEFSYYKDYKLPHIKLIGLTKDMNDGLSILVNLRNEMQKRMTIFTEEGADNIESYYKKGNTKKIARLFVIIDEIQEIFRDDNISEKALSLLSEILALGRACGINVLWGSQSVPSVSGIDNRLMQNIANRICLKVENTDYALRLFSDGINLKPVIDIKNRPEKGYGVISDSRTGNSIKEFRVAYSEDRDNREKYYEIVKERWSQLRCTDDLYVIGDDLVPDVKKDEAYIYDPLRNIACSRLSESYPLSIGTSYVSGRPYSLDIKLLESRANIVFIGTDVALLRDMMGFALLSTIINRGFDTDCLSNPSNKIYYVNKEGTIDPKLALDLYNVLPRERSDKILNVSSAEKFKAAINELYEVYLSRVEAAENGEFLSDTSSYFMFVHYFQYFGEILEKNEPLEDEAAFGFDGTASDAPRLADVVKTLLTKGGDFGIHFIISINAPSVENFYSIKKELLDFKYKIAIRGCDLRSLVPTANGQLSSVNNDRICICYSNGELTKIRPYRYDEVSKIDEQWYRKIYQEFDDASKKGF